MYAFDEGAEMTEDEIVNRIDAIGLRTVEVTGGEPLLQEGVLSLVKRLLDRGYAVLMETNGSMDIGRIDDRAVIIMDVKTPGSGMSDSLLVSNLSHLERKDETKFVIADRLDYEWATAFIREHSLTDRCQVLLSPAFGMLDPRELSRWILDDKLEVRLNLQLHKYIYGPDMRGV